MADASYITYVGPKDLGDSSLSTEKYNFYTSNDDRKVYHVVPRVW